MGLHLDLDDRRGPIAVGRIRRAAAAAHAGRLRRMMDFDPFPEPRPRGPAMASCAGLLAAPAVGPGFFLLLALAPVQRLRQHRPAGPKLRQLSLQRLDARGHPPAPGLRHPRLHAQRRILPAQCRVFLAQRPDRVLASLDRVQRRVFLPPRRGRSLSGLRHPRAQCRVLPAQSPDLLAQRHHARTLAPWHTGRAHQLPQPPHLRLQGQRFFRRAPDRLRFRARLGQLVSTGLALDLPATGSATRGDLRPAPLLRVRFGDLRPRFSFIGACPLPLIHQTPVAPLTRRHRLRERPDPLAPLDQRQFGANIGFASRHARNDSAKPVSLPVPRKPNGYSHGV